ncbi:MAG TPA: DUF459 domain-containing protein [Acidimicrobiales bacterium]
MTRVAPRVLTVHPEVVPGRGGTTILIRGTGFTPSTVITVGGVRALVRLVRNSGAVYAITPRGVGTEIVRAVTSVGTSAANPGSVVHYANRVLVIGDSLGIDLAWGFTPTVDARDHLAVVDEAVGSSGLVRSDFYNWPAHLRSDLAATHPDVVVVLLGTNDQQVLGTSRGIANPGTPAWDKVYAARVRQLGTIIRRARVSLVWVSLPRMGPRAWLDPKFVARLVALDRSAVATIGQSVFVNSWLVFSTARGAYTPYVETAPHVWALGHAQDDIHLTPAGAAVIDAKALEGLRMLLTRR